MINQSIERVAVNVEQVIVGKRPRSSSSSSHYCAKAMS